MRLMRVPRRINDLGKPVGQPFQRGAAVVGIKVDIQQAESGRMVQGGIQSPIELANGPDLQSEPCAENIRNSMVGPVVDIVERTFEQESLGRVTVIVQNDHNRVEPVPSNRR